MCKEIKNSSEALKINLNETRVHSFKLTEKETFVVDAVSEFPPLKRRLLVFFKELNHPFPNTKEIVESFREIILENLIVFSQVERHEEMFVIIKDIFYSIFSLKLEYSTKDRLKKTLFETLEIMYKIYGQGFLSYKLIDNYLNLISDVLTEDRDSLVESSSSLKRYLTPLCDDKKFSERIFFLMRKALIANINYWKNISTFENWIISSGFIFDDVTKSVDKLISSKFNESFFQKVSLHIENSRYCSDLLSIPDYTFFIDNMRNLTDSLVDVLGKIYYLFYILQLEPMTSIREYLLFDLNRVFKTISINDGNDYTNFIKSVFQFFQPLKNKFQSAILDCIKTLGIEIVNKGEDQVLNEFFKEVIAFGFIYPDIQGVNSDWQIIADRNHVKNIRVWLEIIETNPSRCKILLSALLINLRVGGVFISDTDLFQSDVTKLLNSDVSYYYHIVRQIAVLFPVYFNEIGAEGELRKVSTAIDEISFRNDRLIHFLRKQIHAESNNTHIDLVKSIFVYWMDGDKDKIAGKIPEDVYAGLIISDEKYYSGVHDIASYINNIMNGKIDDIFSIRIDKLEDLINKAPCGTENDKKRVTLLFRLYLLLKEKYYLNPRDIVKKLRSYTYIDSSILNRLDFCLNSENWNESVEISFQIMSLLKSKVLSSEKSEGIENIYYKRHIAIGIPSMYGSYREVKFEALGMIFRLEQLIESLIDKIISNINLSYISAKTLREVTELLELFKEGLSLGGISSENFNSNLKILKNSLVSSSFSIDQYANIFEFMTEDIRRIIIDYFLGVHDSNLAVIISQFVEKNSFNFISPKEKELFFHKKSEEFYRDVISSSFLVQKIDGLINNVLSLLNEMPANLSPEEIHMIMSYRKDLITVKIGEEKEFVDNQIFMGAKGYFLNRLNSYKMPVPSGFILTTELFRRRNALFRHPEIKKEIENMIKNEILFLEKVCNLEFGNPEKPLLLSVRSGSAMSMPGAMSTFLNVGMNDEFVEKLSKKENYGWTSWDCYRRLIQTWGMNFGIERDVFDFVIADFKKVYKVNRKTDFKPAVMREIAFKYMEILSNSGVLFEQNLNKQLMCAINSVFDSWDSKRAQIYRKKLNIASEWGTAVIVQKMVLGNINYDSGTGVVFTREPQNRGREVQLYGDFTVCSQGEDVVGGLVHPHPVSERQRKSMKEKIEISMEKDFPQIYSSLNDIATKLVCEKGYGHQEIEFTFETEKSDDFYILQIRPYHQHDVSPVDMLPDDAEIIDEGTGIGCGLVAGRAVFSMQDIEKCKELYPNESLIAVRPDTVSDDIDIIFESDGLLTSRGGATSHAAVTAVRLGKAGVVNCRSLVVFDARKEFFINQRKLKVFDKIIIDGKNGFIYISDKK